MRNIVFHDIADIYTLDFDDKNVVLKRYKNVYTLKEVDTRYKTKIRPTEKEMRERISDMAPIELYSGDSEELISGHGWAAISIAYNISGDEFLDTAARELIASHIVEYIGDYDIIHHMA